VEGWRVLSRGRAAERDSGIGIELMCGWRVEWKSSEADKLS
jgi:hypothetical protein